MRSDSQSSTETLARRIATFVRPGDAILLSGPLGAGKSVFARAFLRALCDDPALDVPSPTFTLVQTYDSPRGPVAHFDLWRLSGPDALEELGWEEWREGVVLVEWPDRLEDLTPHDALCIELRPLPGGDEENAPREILISGWEARLS